jgi:hypothetical protein
LWFWGHRSEQSNDTIRSRRIGIYIGSGLLPYQHIDTSFSKLKNDHREK